MECLGPERPSLWRMIDAVITRYAMPILLAAGYTDCPNNHARNLPRLSKPFGSHELAVILTTLNQRPLAR